MFIIKIVKKETTTYPTMEQYLPIDMINLILGDLSNYELFQYSITSKTSLQSAERVWNKRNQIIQPRIQRMIQAHNIKPDIIEDEMNKLSIVRGMTAYKTYSHSVYFVVYQALRDSFGKIERIKNVVKKTETLDTFLGFVNENFDIMKQHVKFEKFLNAVKQKFKEFMFGSSHERQLAYKYFPLLFPVEFNQTLIDLHFEEEYDSGGEDEWDNDQEQDNE